MIDIIIIDSENVSLQKILFSILIQTLHEKVHVYLIDNKKNTSLSFFQERITIDEVLVDDNYDIMRKIGLDAGSNEFVLFLNSGDVFYDVFSLNNLYKLDRKSVV